MKIVCSVGIQQVSFRLEVQIPEKSQFFLTRHHKWAHISRTGSHIQKRQKAGNFCWISATFEAKSFFVLQVNLPHPQTATLKKHLIWPFLALIYLLLYQVRKSTFASQGLPIIPNCPITKCHYSEVYNMWKFLYQPFLLIKSRVPL